MLIEIVLAVVGIMALDYLKKGWRGWGYYGLAFLVVLAVHIAYMVAVVIIDKSIH